MERCAVNLAALHEALDAATLAALVAESGDAEVTATVLAIAATAATAAFPAGHLGLHAVRMLLAIIEQEAES